MVALDKLTGGVKFGRFTKNEELAKAITKYIKQDLNDVVFFCVGTDRSTGDSYAPFVGMKLKELGYTNVIGCIHDPAHAVNLDEKIAEIPEGKTVIAIDACLGLHQSVGTISLNKGSLSPGAGVGKDLTKVGDFNIQGVVNVSGFMEFFVLQNTRLSLVMNMVNETVTAIQAAFPLVDKKSEFETYMMSV
ncbi:spore protease YyaC [Bacillus sp. T33-2]|uniref:spore protease YyaC n=1 Tax=Bacillus sp. T33-2 TaxID=2054168 RepID=UPI000C7905FF|nr:spore protease YyaC [Bacillus sp. T33-2]PLR99545.1 spore protease YyaC [Bacillus sp. T33-2]